MIWRTHLTGEEKQTVFWLDDEIENARLLDRMLTAQREIIRRRATARGKRKMESVK